MENLLFAFFIFLIALGLCCLCLKINDEYYEKELEIAEREISKLEKILKETINERNNYANLYEKKAKEASHYYFRLEQFEQMELKTDWQPELQDIYDAVKFAMIQAHPDHGGNVAEFRKYHQIYKTLNEKVKSAST